METYYHITLAETVRECLGTPESKVRKPEIIHIWKEWDAVLNISNRYDRWALRSQDLHVDPQK